jgi:hypothetical protein
MSLGRSVLACARHNRLLHQQPAYDMNAIAQAAAATFLKSATALQSLSPAEQHFY